ncbi:IPT/TIG domain-containing protein [Actinoplanes subglobosus]|uniref:IPT/TIG domain-containing protein n=1 Tax=Actinoplanes subglobosus TaxID=1547892 RepID=A0ABV8IL16_9ACTN
MTSVGAFTSITAASGRFVANSGTCPTTFGTTSGTNLAATVVVNDADTATLTVPALAAGTYRACIYGVTSGAVAGTTPLSVNSTDTLVLSGANTAPTLNPSVGPITSGATITATGLGPYLASATTPAATFKLASVGACATTYTTTSATAATTVTKNVANTVATITAPALTAGTYNLCVYAGSGTSSALLATTSYTAMAAPTLSPKAGNSAGGNTITVTTPTAVITGGSPAVTFTKGNCPTTYAGVNSDHVAAVTVTKISTSKVAVLVPVGVVVDSGASTTAWNTCLFMSNAGNLIAAPAVYTVAPALGAANPAISPSGGPAQGGTSIVITGLTGIPTADGATLSASLGGSPLENLAVVDATSISGKTTAHAAGDVKLSVTTAAGTQTSTANEFTYSYGITISPTASATNTTPTIDVMGAGFSSITGWGTAATAGVAPATGAYVFLVNNSWFTSASNGSGLNAGLVTQCTSPTVISDNELICTLDLANTLGATGLVLAADVPDGAYSLVVVNDISDTSLDAATQYSRVSSGATLTVSEY